MNNVILSVRYPQFAQALKERGYHVIPAEEPDCFIPYERDHADLQCLIIDDTAFVLSRCQTLVNTLRERFHIELCGENIHAKYPFNVALNAAVVGKNIIARADSLDPKVVDYCTGHGYRIHHVRQGYASCSSAVVSEDAFITADRGIYYSLKESNFDILMIEEGRVTLSGAVYGFIGGASGLDINDGDRILYFSGDVIKHPDYPQIERFCHRHGTQIVSLTEDELTDIGGMIFC